MLRHIVNIHKDVCIIIVVFFSLTSCCDDGLTNEDDEETSLWKMNSPFISLVDDDTLSPDHITKFHTMCTDNDIVGTYACITSRGVMYPTLFPLLHQYEADGFDVALHCYEQRNFYRWSQNLDITVTGVTNLNVGDKYTYESSSKSYTLDIEELHINSDGSGNVYFNFMADYQQTPKHKTGIMTRVSGSGDETITFSDYTVREFRDSLKVKADMQKAIDDLKANGFTDYSYFVSPYGCEDDGLQKIAKEMGMKCLVSISNEDYLTNSGNYTQYEIPRFGFNAYDSSGHTMDELKQLIDYTASSNGWLLVGTHVYNGWTDELVNTRFKEFVDYAKHKGLKFVTLKEGFDRYEKVLNHYGK